MHHRILSLISIMILGTAAVTPVADSWAVNREIQGNLWGPSPSVEPPEEWSWLSGLEESSSRNLVSSLGALSEAPSAIRTHFKTPFGVLA